jgi:hypothetical protein
MNFVNYPRHLRAASRGAIPVILLGLLTACVAPPPRTYRVAAPPPPRVFVYPAQGQSPEQTERDRYDCHLWAVQQTGVDPSRGTFDHVVVQPSSPPGANTAGGAVVGAVIGSIIAPYNPGAGFLLGGATGALVGSAADASAQAQAQQTQQQFNQAAAEGRARADAYRRAFGACLVGRGYTVN